MLNTLRSKSNFLLPNLFVIISFWGVTFTFYDWGMGGHKGKNVLGQSEVVVAFFSVSGVVQGAGSNVVAGCVQPAGRSLGTPDLRSQESAAKNCARP